MVEKVKSGRNGMVLVGIVFVKCKYWPEQTESQNGNTFSERALHARDICVATLTTGIGLIKPGLGKRQWDIGCC